MIVYTCLEPGLPFPVPGDAVSLSLSYMTGHKSLVARFGRRRLVPTDNDI